MTEARESPSHDPIGRAFAELGAPGVDRSATESLAVGRTIGPYQLVRVLGEGGMGTVYLAEQSTPVRRTVALKVLRASATSRAAERRFEAERQALALLDHPSIASIHDAGVTDAEQPYFAMDHVDGPPITRYCDEHRLGLRARVALLRDVCLAVQHAHQRGVIHRDLKPSNVLVTERDGKPLPKVIDFGIAKFELEHEGAPEQSLLTLTGQVIGTPEYMSPEQAAGGARTIDTRTDVYSLGVILYELLTGTLPLELARGRGASLEEALRVIREVDPPRPSQRLRTTLVEPTTDDAAPGDTPALVRLVRGDLDWIALMALEKDPERRYASPLELARDLDRFLEHRTVLATPPSARYRASKFLRRNRAKVVAASLLLLSLVVGLIGTTTYLVRSLASERRAIAEKQRAEGQRLAAEARVIAESHPTRALLLALEANELTPGRAANDALYAALTHIRERHVLYGHDSRLTVTTFDPDDKWLLTAAEHDRFVNVWDAATGVLVHRLGGGDEALHLATFARGGEWVVASTLTGKWSVWDAASGTLLAEATTDAPVIHVAGLTAGARIKGLVSVESLSLDPRGERMALGCEDGLVRIVRPLTGELLAALGEVGPPCIEVEFDPTGTLLVATHGDMSYRAWRGEDLVQVVHDTGSTPDAWELRRAVVAPDGRCFACLRRNDLEYETVVYAADGAELARFAGMSVLDYSPDGASLHLTTFGTPWWTWERYDLAAGAFHEPVQFSSPEYLGVLTYERCVWAKSSAPSVLDRDGTELDRLVGHVYKPGLIDHDRRGGRLATGSDDRSARVWDLESRTRPRKIGNSRPDAYQPLAIGPLGLLIHLRPEVPGDSTRQRSEVLDVERGNTVLVFDDPRFLTWPRMTRAGSHLFAFRDERIEVQIPGEASIFRDLRVELARVDLATGERVEAPLDPMLWFDASPDGQKLVLGRERGAAVRLGIYDVESRTELPLLQPLDWTPWVVAWNPHEHTVAVRYDGERALVVDERTGIERFTVGGHDADIVAMAFSPDGRFLLTASVDRTAIVRDASTGAQLVRYRGLDGEPQACGFTQDARLAWVTTTKEAHLFAPYTGQSFARIEPTEGYFVGAVVSGDDRELVTVTSFGTLQRWPLDPVAYARSVVPRDFEPDELDQFQLGEPAERLDRMERIARATPTAARLARTGSLLAQLGELDRAITLHEEAALTGTLEAFPWFELGRLLARRYASATDAEVRDATAARAVEVLRRAGELGVEVETMTKVEDFDALRAAPGFQAMLVEGR